MEILASILGGLVGGLFTFLGVLVTIKHDEKKRNEEKVGIQEQMRPRLEILKLNSALGYSKTSKADICMILCKIVDFKNDGKPMFYYKPEVINSNEWVCYEYFLKNVGKTEIDHIYFSTNLYKNTSLFSVSNGRHKLYYDTNYLNYSVLFDKPIMPDEEFSVKICYVKDSIIVSSFANPMISIWMVDVNGNWWKQEMFAPDERILTSKRTTQEKWYNATNVDKALECFIDPMLW